MIPQSFDYRDDPGGEPFRCIGLIHSHVSTNFPEPRSRQRRPDDLYRHSASSSWSLPQTHLGGGSSWSVPQDKSQAFRSSCLT